jgi:hypothetical protein
MISIILLGILFLIFRAKGPSVELFLKARSYENSGHFEDAVIFYESALSEVGKIRFQNNLRSKIVERIKVLQTAIEYKNGLRFIR